MKQIENRLDDIEELFDRADENRDDQVTLQEFRGLMLALDRQMQETAVAATFLLIDTDRDGLLGFAEFRSWWLNN